LASFTCPDFNRGNRFHADTISAAAERVAAGIARANGAMVVNLTPHAWSEDLTERVFQVTWGKKIADRVGGGYTNDGREFFRVSKAPMVRA